MILKKVKERVKKNKIIYATYVCINNAIRNLFAIRCFMVERKIVRKHDKIRVIFLMQLPAVWNKFSSIYESMKNDQRFEPLLICVPDGLENGKVLDPENNSNSTYDYFISKGYDAINALVGDNEWLDLKALEPNYVFFSRPYNDYMPSIYRSSQISKYAKICSVLYAINMTVETRSVVLNKDFYRNVYCYFAETKSAQQHNIRNFRIAHLLGLQKTLFYGMPALEKMVQAEQRENEVWDFSDNSFRVLWTPRWTTDLKLGGTNFFTYYLWFLEYAKKRSDMSFLFRPHPLAFSNFLKQGLLTEKEIEEYIREIDSSANVQLDYEKEYEATFWKSSVLVSDTSSIVAEYFVTGKPLVFCMSNMILEPEKHTKRILEGCYVVYNKEELEKCLESLSEGKDPLKTKRLQIIQEVFGDSLSTATKKIVEELSRQH